MPATTSLWIATLAVLVHSLAMLVTTGAVALVVYQWVGLDFLRRGWINLDLVWTAALIGMGLGCCSPGLTDCVGSGRAPSLAFAVEDRVDIGPLHP